MSDTKVYLLESGSITVPSHQIFWIDVPVIEPYRFPVYSVMIEHREGLFLFDTGLDGDLVQRFSGGDPDRMSQTAGQSLEAQMALVGKSPGDVDLVMNSHYHFDHVGGNKLCTCAKTIAHKREMEAFENPHPAMEAPGYQDRSFLEARGAYKPRFEMVTGDQRIASGVTLLETPGHTAGHYSLLVELSGRRPMLFTGDACYCQQSWERHTIPALHVDPRQAYASISRLKELAEAHDAEPFFAHDRENFPEYIKAPGHYC